MLVLLIRDALLIAIAVLVIREIWYPELDLVRSSPLEDPGGGPFDGAEDHPIALSVPSASSDTRLDPDPWATAISGRARRGPAVGRRRRRLARLGRPASRR